ncbi:MAG TPA: UPF0182 family protein [Balneolaceae bacterium]
MGNNIFSKSIFRIGIIVLLAVLLIGGFTDWIIEWLWLDNLGYEQVFLTIKTTQILLFISSLAIALLYVLPNMSALAKNFSYINFGQSPLAQLNLHSITPAQFRKIFWGLGAALSVFFSIAFFTQWDKYFRFHWSEMFGQLDPIFGNDIGFYLFRLPFIQLVQNSLISLVFFVTIALIILYIYSGALSIAPSKRITAAGGIKKQVSVNLGIWLLLLSWGYYLDRYNILYSESGIVYGASYVDVSINLPVTWVLCMLCFLLALLAFFQLYKNRFKWLLIGGLATFVIGAIGTAIVPAITQSYVVEPNELELEKPFIKNNIELTREAYALDEMHTRNYRAGDTLSWAQIQNNQAVIRNIRLWDQNLLLQTYRQLQEIRLYYQFYNVDVDRYHTSEGYLQMMLSARQLAQDLPEQAQTWVNQRLQYTHGYGLVMTPVAQQTVQGDPKMVIKNLPPVTQLGFEVERPAIYFGEENSDYKIVNTEIKELHYPRGDQNVYTHYAGTGGLSINNFFEKLLFSWEFGDINILLTDYIRDGSKIIFWKTIGERVRRIAPFLQFEDDPYLVLSDGKLYWIQDAYTISEYYPYSEPVEEGDFNYIRNSVKIVVDAYNGSVDFYAVNEQEPILNVYRNVFPDMFKTLDEMPEHLKQHLRYPKYYFVKQVEMFNTYHMTDPQVFYNSEDLWVRPTERYAGRQIRMEPYYLLSKLPGQESLQYLLIMPVTPRNRDNMIAWIAAKSDFPQYGEVTVFELPKERLILGPAQVEARIDQDTKISRQLSLWDQRGSNVVRGHLLIIPIENSFLYVEPVFLISQQLNIPQLQRVIVATGEKIVMEPTLSEALRSLYGKTEVTQPLFALPNIIETPEAETSAQFRKTRILWKEAIQALQEGNWQLFGEKMKAVEELLD